MSYQPIATGVVTPDYSMGKSIRSVPMLFDGGTTAMKYRHNTLDISGSTSSAPRLILKNDKIGSDKMSIAFKEVFNNYTTNTNENEKNHNEGEVDRISDAFRRGEQLLMSNDNVRPKSRSKSSLNMNDKISPSSDNTWQVIGLPPKSTKPLHSHISDNTMRQIFTEVTPAHDGSNNAQGISDMAEPSKKGKKHRKRVKSSSKGKSNKHGRTSAPVAGLPRQDPAKRSSAPSMISSPNTHASKPVRVSSEPPSKISQADKVSFTLQNIGSELTANKQACNSLVTKHNSDLHPFQDGTSKTSPSNQVLPTSKYSHGNSGINTSSNPNINNLLSLGDILQAQATPLLIHKPSEVHTRVKSGHSFKSEPLNVYNASNNDDCKDNATVLSEQLSLTATSCKLTHTKPSTSAIHDHYNRQQGQTVSSDSAAKVAELTSIYGAVFQTANQVKSRIEELKKVKKIFLSDKQSGTIKESGMEYPCAPPATPTPDVLRKYEYVPSLADIRSQRAVKQRLQVMEKDAQKKKDKQKDAHAKLEKQLSKDKEKQLKIIQRRQIYALNKIMTDLEYKRFLEFCQSKGLKS